MRQPHLLRPVSSLAPALLLLVCATRSFGFDTAYDSYDPNSGQLTIPSLSIGNAMYSDVVLHGLGANSVIGVTGGTAVGSPDNYDPATRRLTVPFVLLLAGYYPFYTNVVVEVPAAVSASIGSVVGADLYSGGRLTIPEVQYGNAVYRNVVLAVSTGAIRSVAGGLPRALRDQYDSAHAELLIPVVQSGARIYTNVTIAATLQDIVSVGGTPAAAPTIAASSGNGAQNGAQIVTLSDSTPGASIHFTVDNSTPTPFSPLYEAPFLVASNLTVRAIASAPGYLSSAMTEQVFAPNIPPGTLVWSEEFNENTTGGFGQPNPAIWTYEAGGGGWGNAELENYCPWGSNVPPCNTNSPNAYVGTDGYLHIVARQPSPGVYTSARLKTQGLFSFQYGRFEVSVRVPEAAGLWPAAWLMGNNLATVGWPAAGEMDVQERWDAATTPDATLGSIHGTGFTGGLISAPYTFPSGQSAAGFHSYGMIWNPATANYPAAVAYYVDAPTAPYVIYTPLNLFEYPDPNTQVLPTWPFDTGASFILLNLAIGGSQVGPPDSSTAFPAETLVDYVRVYTPSANPAWTAGPAATTPTPPSLPAGSVLPVFSTHYGVTSAYTYTGGASAPSGCMVGFPAYEQAYPTGNGSVLEYTLAVWDFMEFGPFACPAQPAGINASPYRYLHLDVWSPDPPPVVNVALGDYATNPNGVRKDYFFSMAGHASAWLGVDIPLTAPDSSLRYLGLVAQSANGVNLTGTTTLYVDNVYFHN